MCSLTSAHARTGDGWKQAMTVYVIVQLKMTDRAAYDRCGRLLSADEKPTIVEGAWDRDKLVLMSFPDEAAFRAERIFRLSGIRLAARKCAQSIVCAYSDRKTGIHFCGIRAANSPEYLEISKDRKAGAQAIVLLAKGFAP
jgi:uncharacterized protein (DUF1330 family)